MNLVRQLSHSLADTQLAPRPSPLPPLRPCGAGLHPSGARRVEEVTYLCLFCGLFLLGCWSSNACVGPCWVFAQGGQPLRPAGVVVVVMLDGEGLEVPVSIPLLVVDGDEVSRTFWE